MISPKVMWKHDKDWWVTLYKCDDQLDLEEASVKVMLNDPYYSFLSGHVIDGNDQNVFFFTFLVWHLYSHAQVGNYDGDHRFNFRAMFQLNFYCTRVIKSLNLKGTM